MDGSTAVAAIKEIEALCDEQRRLSASEVALMQNIGELECENEQIATMWDTLEAENRDLKDIVSEMEHLQKDVLD